MTTTHDKTDDVNGDLMKNERSKVNVTKNEKMIQINIKKINQKPKQKTKKQQQQKNKK